MLGIQLANTGQDGFVTLKFANEPCSSVGRASFKRSLEEVLVSSIRALGGRKNCSEKILTMVEMQK